MKILVYGAGVLGCNLARNLFRAGKDVTLLARGNWAEEIRKNGLRIKDKFSLRTSVSCIPVVTTLAPDAQYDVIFVVLRYTQLGSALDTLQTNRTKNIVFVGNNVRARALAAALPEKNVLFAFALSAGHREADRVVSIVERTHEAIISKEDFELAQKVIRGGGRNPTRKQHDYPLKGLVRCGNCKRAMTRRKNKAGIRYFQCIHSVNNGNTDCPVGRSFPEMDIEKVVFNAITQFLTLAQKEAIQSREVGDLRKSAIKECADKIRTLQKQNEQHKASKLRLYEKYAAGSITKEAYIQQKAATDAKIAENDEAIQRSHERMKELDSETSCSDEKLDAVCDQYADCKALTYELTHVFISAVYIYDLDNIEIVWKFKDFLTTSEGEAK